jgi:hypothetical protein
MSETLELTDDERDLILQMREWKDGIPEDAISQYQESAVYVSLISARAELYKMAIRHGHNDVLARRDSHIKRQAGKCYYCGCLMSETSHKRFPTLDHFVPLALGGDDHFENTVAACKTCNTEKSAMHGSEFLALKARGIFA